MVFLILAAQYERWSLPLSVLLALPFGTFGALAAVYLRGYTNDVYFQIGLVTLLGLAAKNAILIVQFAELKEREGLSAAASALEAARLRFRPILMTSLAFIFGVMPLAFSTGAGAGARRSVGTGVMGGMMAATFLAIFFVPMFFKLLTDRRLLERRSTAELKDEIERARTVTHAQVQHPHHAPHPHGEFGFAFSGLLDLAALRAAPGRAARRLDGSGAAVCRGRALVAHLSGPGAGRSHRGGPRGERRSVHCRRARGRGACPGGRSRILFLPAGRRAGQRQPPADLEAHRHLVSRHSAPVQRLSDDAQPVLRSRPLRAPARRCAGREGRARRGRSRTRGGTPGACRAGGEVLFRVARARRADRAHAPHGAAARGGAGPAAHAPWHWRE